MGGFTAAAFGTKYPGHVDGIILSGALTRYNKEIFGPLPVDKPDDFYFDNELGDGVCSDPAVVKAYEMIRWWKRKFRRAAECFPCGC
ncbi:lysophospholipase [Sinobaca sp. H24]|uniref:lysophospholipase n=1 Tax=Sinobaca sp. H24 TaxID=2923376 RepID=UPI00207968FE|nr:lysophospholipase [Sinobaca sp. H24]